MLNMSILRTKKRFSLILLCLLFSSCEETGFKDSKTFIDGRTASKQTLSLGKQVYLEYCMACHGMNGEGNGPASKGSIPAPRNLTQGLYKFGLVKNNALPTDKDFHRIIKKGLHGTGMLPWDVSDDQIDAVIQYIKTLAPQIWEGKDKSLVGEKIELGVDPYGLARKNSGVERGKEVYHVVANCQSCHQAYVTKDELNVITKKVTGTPASEFDPTIYNLKIQESEYYLYENKERRMKFLPPDFTWHTIRSANTVEEIAQRLCAGITGTGMPAWCGAIPDDDIWAAAYYTKSLMDLRGKHTERTLLIKSLEN